MSKLSQKPKSYYLQSVWKLAWITGKINNLGHFVEENLQSAKQIVGTLMLFYHLTRVSKIVDLKVEVSFSNDIRDHPFIYPSPFPTIQCWVHKLGGSKTSCRPTLIWGTGGNIWPTPTTAESVPTFCSRIVGLIHLPVVIHPIHFIFFSGLS